MLLDDSTPAGHALVRAFDAGEANSDMMFAAAGTVAPWMASVTFGGPDLRTAYLGSLRGTRIPFSAHLLPGYRWCTGFPQPERRPAYDTRTVRIYKDFS